MCWFIIERVYLYFAGVDHRLGINMFRNKPYDCINTNNRRWTCKSTSIN